MTCDECGAKTKVVTCARCREPINALTENYRSAVPGLGNLCMGCHGDWLEDRAERTRICKILDCEKDDQT